MHVFIAGDSRWPRLWTWCERSWSFRTLGLLEIQDVGPGTLQRQVQPLRSYSALIWTLLQRPGHFYSALGISTLTALRAPWASQLKFQMSGNWRQWRWPESSRDSRVSITAKNTHHHECLRNGVAVLIPISKYMMVISGIFIFSKLFASNFLKATLTAATNWRQDAGSHCQHKLQMRCVCKHAMARRLWVSRNNNETAATTAICSVWHGLSNLQNWF